MEQKPKILVVDDEIPVCKSISKALLTEGYTVDMALSGEEAIKKENENKYDVIITDLMMPGISGMELLKIIKEKRDDARIIMLTGYPSVKTAVQSIKLGAFDYMPKPFTPNELRSLVSRALERKCLYEKEISKENKKDTSTKLSTPSGLYCISEHSWAKVENDGNVRIGVHHIFLTTVGEISSIDFPSEDDMVYQGDVCIKINDTDKHIHKLWTPISGRIVSVNEKLKNDYSDLINDPYGNGWILLITPLNLDEDLKNLILL